MPILKKPSGLLEQLAECKGVFGREGAARVVGLLRRASKTRFRDAEALIRLHETMLFLRAYPASPGVLRLADQILFDFAARLHGVNPTPFEAAEVSGIAGSALSTNFSHTFALHLA
ncbi:MAG: hypothetical protein ABI995_12525, partial [Acidobacteriota bacterium]